MGGGTQGVKRKLKGAGSEKEMIELTGAKKENIETHLEKMKRAGLIDDWRIKDGYYEWILNDPWEGYSAEEIFKAIEIMALMDEKGRERIN